LIGTRIEPQVIEVYDEAGGDLASFVDAHRGLAGRVEVSGETAFFYCREPQLLLAALAERRGLRNVHRASNLEDVFIQLTGRELRD
jgi:lipooligosaccharide transport system ATP-binding protein